jgi:ketosteroid isomerase-like protein
MAKREFLAMPLLVATLFSSCSAPDDFKPDTIIALERAALDRWGKGDPKGYLETYARDVSYFDPIQDRRVDGLGAMTDLLTPLTGKIRVDRYEMIGPKVQRRGDVAVLSYQLVSYARGPNGQPFTVRWNSTAVYERLERTWKIIHSHWSFTKPEVKLPAPQ